MKDNRLALLWAAPFYFDINVYNKQTSIIAEGINKEIKLVRKDRHENQDAFFSYINRINNTCRS